MLFLVLLLLFWLRFQDLGLKAVHHDESINGWFTSQLWNQGWYDYDPTNYHGPLLFYLFQFGELVNGWGIETLRAVTVAFSCAWLLYLWRFWKRYQWSSSWFILIVALSPGFFFYARSAIHETPFLFFLTLAMGGLLEIVHYQQSRGWRSLIWGLAGAILLKETWVILALALVLSALILGGLQSRSWLRRGLRNPRSEIRSQKLRLRASWPENGGLHLFFALFAIALLYTGFGAQPAGLGELVQTYLPWLKTGVQSGGHEKPVYYWVKLLWLYEGPLLFLFVGLLSTAILFWRRLSVTAQWLGLAAIFNVLIYSLIPYKTPWCFISVWGPMVFVYGLIKTELRWVNWGNPLQGALAIAAFVALGFQWDELKELNFEKPSAPGHDYVYVQTDGRLKAIADQLHEAAQKNPALYSLPLHLAGTEPWPLAWWLGRFSHQHLTGFDKGVVSGALLVVIDEKDFVSAKETYSPDEYDFHEFPIREGREPSLFLIRKDMASVRVPDADLRSHPKSSPPTREGER